MAREFTSLAGFAEFLAERSVVAAEEARLALGRGAKLIADRAKSKIGHEQPDWPPLAESTLEEKARLGYGVPDPLLREGDLRDSIEFQADGDQAAVGSDDPVAEYQELGTSTIPPRSFLASSAAEQSDRIAALIGTAYYRALAE